MNSTLELDGISKSYVFKNGKTIHAVKSVSLSIKPGTVYGLLGPNGAGKTSTIRCALGLTPQDSGEIRIFGQEIIDRAAIMAKIGYCPDHFCLPGELSPREHLRFFAKLQKGKHIDQRVDKWINRLGLDEVGNRPCNFISLGNNQKLLIAQAFINDPKLIFLDEPTQGLDPMTTDLLGTLIKEAAEKDAAVILSSHQLAQVEKVCHRAGIINNGELVAEDKLENLVAGGGLEDYFINVVRGE